MAKKTLKVGLIGVGGIAGDQHLPYWKELAAEGRAEIVATCDIIPERARRGVEEFGAQKAYLSYKKMLKENAFDVVDVCTQNRWHCPMTVDALEAGANVLCEKPMAMNVGECQQMIGAATTFKKKLMIAQHMRFEPANEKLKEVVDRGTLGTIYTASARYLRRRGIPGWGKFHIKKESLGGPMIDIGVHVLDLAVWLMGCPRPVAVSGKVYRKFGDRPDLENGEWGRGYPPKEFDVEDYAVAFVRFENDATMMVDVSWAANIPEEMYGVMILGDKAGVSTNPLAVSGYEQGALLSTRFDWVQKDDGHRREIRHFTECLEENKPVRVQPVESLQIQKIIDAVYLSSRRNREVVIK